MKTNFTLPKDKIYTLKHTIMKSKMKILALNYQRNGVAGNGFYSVLTDNLEDQKGKFLITFEMKGDDDTIDIPSCRVVMLDGLDNSFYQCWRGDRIACDVKKQLEALKTKHKVKSWYDLKCLLQNKATGSTLQIEYA